MTDTWRQVALGDVAAEVTVGYVGPMASEYVSDGVPFLRSLNVREHRIDLADVRYITPTFNERLAKSLLRPGDVVTVRTGKPGTTAVIPESLPIANCSDVVITRPGGDLDSRWLSYYINGVADGFVASRLVGAVQQHFNVGSAKEMQLLLPPIEEQRAIAATLGALDDRIESNLRAIDLAETLGDSLFAQAASATTALADAAHLTMGSSPPGSSYNEDGIGRPFYQGVRDFGRRFPGLRVWTTQPVRLAEANDTLVSVRAPVGDLNRASVVCCIGRGVASVRSEMASTIYYALRAASDLWAPFQQEGTVFGAINRADLAAAKLPWPDSLVAPDLEMRLSALDERIASLSRESDQLKGLRDALLPELLSGRIRVPVGADEYETPDELEHA